MMTRKGGDNFMQRIEVGARIPASVTGLNNPCFPESAGRTRAEATGQLPTVALAAEIAAFRVPTALEIATTVDRSLAKDIDRMDGESGMQVARIGRGIRSGEEIATTIDRVALASVGSMDGRE